MFWSVWRAELLDNGETAVSNMTPPLVLTHTGSTAHAREWLWFTRRMKGWGGQAQGNINTTPLHNPSRLCWDSPKSQRCALWKPSPSNCTKQEKQLWQAGFWDARNSPDSSHSHYSSALPISCSLHHQQSLSTNDSSVRTNPSLSHSNLEGLTTVHKKHWPGICWNRSVLTHIL